MNKFIYWLIILLVVLSMFSCEKIVHALFFPHGEEPYKLPQSFSFSVLGLDSLFVSTLKEENARFYVVFSKDSLANPSKNQDYIKFDTNDSGDIGIVFNPNKKNDIYVRASKFLDSVNATHYNLQILRSDEFDSLFYEPQIGTSPPILKYPFIKISIITSSHLIFLDRYVDKYSLVQTKIDCKR